MREADNATPFLIEKPEGKIPLSRPRRRCGNNIKMYAERMCLNLYPGFTWLGLGSSGGHF
jgi:hypothetical protein